MIAISGGYALLPKTLINNQEARGKGPKSSGTPASPGAPKAPTTGGRPLIGPVPSRPPISPPKAVGKKLNPAELSKFANFLQLLEIFIKAKEETLKKIIKKPNEDKLRSRLKVAIEKAKILKEKIEFGQEVEPHELNNCIAELGALETELQAAGLGSTPVARNLTKLINTLECTKEIMSFRSKSFENALEIYDRAKKMIPGSLSTGDIEKIFGFSGSEHVTPKALEVMFDDGKISSMDHFHRICRTIARNVEAYVIPFLKYCKAERFTVFNNVSPAIFEAFKRLGIKSDLTYGKLNAILSRLRTKQSSLHSRMNNKEDALLASKIRIYNKALGRVPRGSSEKEQAQRLKEELAAAMLGEMRRYIDTEHSESGANANHKLPEEIFKELADLSKDQPKKFAYVVYYYLKNGSIDLKHLDGSGPSIDDVRIPDSQEETVPRRSASKGPDTGLAPGKTNKRR